MRVNGRFKIIGIVGAAAVSRRSAARGAARPTVSFRTGESTAAYTGTLAAGEHESYVVKASRNELLDVRVDRVQGRDIVARVLDAATTDADRCAGRRTARACGPARVPASRRLPDRRRADGAGRGDAGADLLAHRQSCDETRGAR